MNRQINPLSVLFGFNAEWTHRRSQIGLQAGMKPPNIIILSSKEGNIPKWKNLLENILSKNMYVIYELMKEDLLKAHWIQNVSLLVMDHVTELTLAEHQVIDGFFENGGNAFFHCTLYPQPQDQAAMVDRGDTSCPAKEECTFQDDYPRSFTGFVSKSFQEIPDAAKTKTFCSINASGNSIVSLCKIQQGKFVISALDFISSVYWDEEHGVSEVDVQHVTSLLKQSMRGLGLSCSAADVSDNVNLDINQLTPGYLSGDSEAVQNFTASFRMESKNRRRMANDLNLHFVEPGESAGTCNEDVFPIVVQNDANVPNCVAFNLQEYWRHLQSSRLGRVIIFSHTVMSTQVIMEKISALSSLSDGVLVIATRQTQGKGRGGNQWLSPEGCMMFSLAASIKISSHLGKRLPFLQHIAAVAVVNAIREVPGYEAINVRIKWPNDIYFGCNVKIGGLVVNSSVTNGEFKAVIGIGVNVSNGRPTVCLDRIIEDFNLENGTCLKPLSIERLIGLIMTNVERLLQMFQGDGYEEFCKIYYNYWLHSDQQIRLGSQDGEMVRVRGLDENGFLLVEQSDGNRLSLQPNGNSFDMMNGLIVIKARQ